jgi:hypothetical protein
MKLQDVEISRHAWLQFKARWNGEPLVNCEAQIRTLLAGAQEENLGYGIVVRLITNGFKPARYFRNGEWRFVTDEEVTNLLTIERAYYQGKLHRKKRRKCSRRQNV